jgi:hypothetical protein
VQQEKQIKARQQLILRNCKRHPSLKRKFLKANYKTKKYINPKVPTTSYKYSVITLKE